MIRLSFNISNTYRGPTLIHDYLIVSRDLNPQNTQHLSIRTFPYAQIFSLTHYATK